MTNKPFGFTMMLDMYGVPPLICDDLETHYRFLEELVDDLGMHKTSAPVVFHGPRLNGIEIYPDKAGVSGWVPLIESGIQIHSVAPLQFVTLDVYSCKPFEQEVVLNLAEKYFDYTSHEVNVQLRGKFS